MDQRFNPTDEKRNTTLRGKFARWIYDDQSVVIVTGTLATITGLALAFGGSSLSFDFLWSILFMAAGVSALYYHKYRNSTCLWKLSGSLLTAAFGSRAALIVIESTIRWNWSTPKVIGLVLWLFATIRTEQTWLRWTTPKRA